MLFHQPLFNQRFLAQRLPSKPTPAEHKKILHDWATIIRSGAIHKQKETEVRGPFIQRFFVEILGYKPIGSGGNTWTINDEKRTGSGSADTALGHFDSQEKRTVAPVELKGADTSNLDAIMPGRHKSPVMQAWEYAMDTPGCQFLLVSNMVEIRLYGVGHTRQVYERFDVLELADSDRAYWRFRTLLGADRLLNGETAKLLKESGLAEKEVTRKLYSEYKTWRIKLLIALMQSTKKPASQLIEPVQKLLDRVLFIAFAEDRGLLPSKTLTHAWQHRDHYNPRPIWENFLGLFRAIDKGNPALSIPAYNGGLFAPVPNLDSLPISDDSCRMFATLGEYDFAEDVSVTVLGHIFEQSISDLEQLKELAGGDDFSLGTLEKQVKESQRAVSGKRKADGIVYTPDAVTRFIVDQTLGTYLTELQRTVRNSFCKQVDGKDVWRKPTKEETAAYTGKNAKLRNTERLVEFLFWTEWRNRLCQVKVADPACGSGAFLVAAFDVLDAEYRRANEQIQAITGNLDLFDINREILNSNLYGVDLNPESIEITKLSLWLKTAQHGKPLESLEANLRVGNSLIDDVKWTNRPFSWHKEFPKVFANKGFDVILGNPPYVRMERLKPVKPYLGEHYEVASDRADLYSYFYELGIKLLKPGGRLGYISSSTFFKTKSGKPLREYMRSNTCLKTLIDFGDLQVFEGVTTYPAIVVLDRREGADPSTLLDFLVVGRRMPESLAAYFEQRAAKMPQSQLGTNPWHLEDDISARLRKKLMDGHPPLKEVYGAPLYGIKTGLNRAFVIDQKVRDRLVEKDPRSIELLRPFLGGKDLKKWRVEPQNQWLIYIPKNRVEIDEFPAIRDHLMQFRHKLNERATKQEWFELQQAQEAYSPKMKQPKIIYGHFSPSPLFSFDDKGYFSNDKSYFVPDADWYALGLLNSKCLWWLLSCMAPAVRGGYYEVRVQYVETLPIPDPEAETRDRISAMAESAQKAAEERRDLTRAFARRVLTDLAPGGTSAKLPASIANWPSLDFKVFQSEVKKHFKTSIPFDDRDAWQARFEKDQARVLELTASIEYCERKIDAEVFQLFQLTPSEIEVIEAESAGAGPDEELLDETAGSQD